MTGVKISQQPKRSPSPHPSANKKEVYGEARERPWRDRSSFYYHSSQTSVAACRVDSVYSYSYLLFTSLGHTILLATGRDLLTC